MVLAGDSVFRSLSFSGEASLSRLDGAILMDPSRRISAVPPFVVRGKLIFPVERSIVARISACAEQSTTKQSSPTALTRFVRAANRTNATSFVPSALDKSDVAAPNVNSSVLGALKVWGWRQPGSRLLTIEASVPSPPTRGMHVYVTKPTQNTAACA
eukprot:1118579-Pyramimonas_sp.AAC.1